MDKTKGPSRLLAALLLVLAVGLLVACDTANGATRSAQSLPINVSDGKFEQSSYTIQPGSVQLQIKTTGGPYTMGIAGLFEPQQLAANTTTTIGVEVPEAKQYQMIISQGGTGTATLDVK